MRPDSTQTIVISSTFTADLLQRPLKFWMDTLDIPSGIAMAPYAQVMQELLNPQSALSQNRRGFNVPLIKLDDWIRDRRDVGVEQNIAHTRKMASDFLTAMGVISNRTSASILVLFCPPSFPLPLIYHHAFEAIQSDLVTRLHSLERVHSWTHADLVTSYPVVVHQDTRVDRIGHIASAG